MIEWHVLLKSFDTQKEYNLVDVSSIDVKETDMVLFTIHMSEKVYQEIGTPLITTSDAPIEIVFSHYENDYLVFKSKFDIDSYKSQYFYNYFGQSEISLYFENDDKLEYLYLCQFNVLVRKANASLAKEMLNYLSERISDTVQICFSRTQVAGGLSSEKNSNYTKIDRIKKTISYLEENYSRFSREHNYNWQHVMNLSESGCPTGPDSIYWALTNLDHLSPSVPEESNVVFNNRNYRFSKVPNESLAKDMDVFENRVIMSFLKYSIHFLSSINNTLEEKDFNTQENSEYVRFDNLLEEYTKQMLNIKIEQYKQLSRKIYTIKCRYQKLIPAKDFPTLPPKLTNYARKHPHYHLLFQYIEDSYKSPEPTLNGNELLHGLKNLSVIYELSNLLILKDVLEEEYGMDLTISEYRIHSYNSGFGGIASDRPEGESNNYFIFRGDYEVVEIFYEPYIYQLSEHTKTGDLINISNNKSHPVYGPHYYKPDFVLRISSLQGDRENIMILDAKYKNSENVEKYDLDELSSKYLLNIHQLGEKKQITQSPISVVMALFAHDSKKKVVSNTNKIHRLDGEYPIFPSISGVHLTPSQTETFKTHFKIAFEAIRKRMLEDNV
ncbi:TPA: hypothetical protein ACX6QF_002505 [Photobacterium damselae]